ncbi:MULTISPECIES: hypothetical protein [Streptomyces]
MYYVVNRVERVGDTKVLKKTEDCDSWWDQLFHYGCTITGKIGHKADLDLFLCTAEGVDAMKWGCPTGSTVYLGEHSTKTLSTEHTHHDDRGVPEGLRPIGILCRSKMRFRSARCGDAVPSGGVVVLVDQAPQDGPSPDPVGLEVGHGGRGG